MHASRLQLPYAITFEAFIWRTCFMVWAGPPSVNDVQIVGDAVEGNVLTGYGKYFGGVEGLSKFEWLREDLESGYVQHRLFLAPWKFIAFCAKWTCPWWKGIYWDVPALVILLSVFSLQWDTNGSFLRMTGNSNLSQEEVWITQLVLTIWGYGWCSSIHLSIVKVCLFFLYQCQKSRSTVNMKLAFKDSSQ